MTDPAHVNARIAAIMERHPNHYWCVPEALAEAVSLWGAGANEHGVFSRHERVEVARLSDSCKAAVLIAESGNGLFGYGLEYSFGMGGGNCFPSIWREAFGSREEARRAAVAELIEQIAGHGNGTPDKRQAELLRRVKKQGQQRTLFD
jgi:hypothetical protein